MSSPSNARLIVSDNLGPPVYAVVLAGGTGERMGRAGPKQFQMLGGKPMLAHSLLAFELSAAITGIVLVSHADHLESAERVARETGISKLISVVPGGSTRSDSSRAGLRALGEDQDGLVLIHDAARPLVEQETIRAVIVALETHRAAAPAMQASDTIVEAADDEIAAMPTRRSLRQVQTPQGFDIRTLRAAYELAAHDPEFQATDDCGVVHRYLPDVAIKLIAGSRRNHKVTNPDDLQVAEVILANCDPAPHA